MAPIHITMAVAVILSGSGYQRLHTVSAADAAINWQLQQSIQPRGLTSRPWAVGGSDEDEDGDAALNAEMTGRLNFGGGFQRVRSAEDASEEAAPHRTKKEVRCFYPMGVIKHSMALMC